MLKKFNVPVWIGINHVLVRVFLICKLDSIIYFLICVTFFNCHCILIIRCIQKHFFRIIYFSLYYFTAFLTNKFPIFFFFLFFPIFFSACGGAGDLGCKRVLTREFMIHQSNPFCKTCYTKVQGNLGLLKLNSNFSN